MKPADEREEALLREALRWPEGPERQAFLCGACGGDNALHIRLKSLLRGHATPALLQPQGAPTDIPTSLLPPEEGPGTVIGRYKILEKVGEGGFGVVYVAEQREPVKRRVALKIIKLGMDTRQVVARFEAERQALALMDHPNIAKVLDAGATETGRPYFVMELVKGIPITQYCDQEKQGTPERLGLFIQVCHAIQHAHQKGIIHRDIKPSNILVTLHDGVPVPKVIDFGIAKATQAELTEKTVYTQYQQFIGTPAYMSPEQAEMSGLDIDTRSDIYSLGVLLYELLTGSTPFDTKELLKSGLDEMRKMIRNREPARPSTRLSQTQAAQPPGSGGSVLGPARSAIDKDLDWIVMKCLEKDRTRRYETANGVAEDIERHLKHEPVVARPPSVGYRLEKSFQRNRFVFTAAGLVGLALVLGAGVSLWQAVRATKAQRNEGAARLRADEAARVADTQRERAEKGEQKARESELAARQSLYDADMILASQALELKNLGRALTFLNRHRPVNPGQRDLRGWEWRYLWGQCRSDELATLGEHGGIVPSVAVSPDGRWVASGGWDGLLKVWELTPRTARTRFITDLHLGGSPVSSVAFSPDGRRLAARSWTNGIALFNVPGWERTMTATNSETGWSAEPVAFSADSRLLAAGGRVLDLDTGVPLCSSSFEFSLGERGVAWLPRSPVLAGFTISNGVDQVSMFDIRPTITTAMVQAIPLRTNGLSRVNPRTLAFSPDGKHLAVGCGDSTIRIHTAIDGREVKILTNHTAWVASVAFSKDGQWLASGGGDHSIRVWRTRDWQETATLRGHEEEVWAIAFTPDGQQLVSGSKDHSVRLWPLTSRSKPVEKVTMPGEGTEFVGLTGVCPFSFGPSNVLCIYDGQTLQVRQCLSSYPVANVVGCRPSPDSRMLLMQTARGGLWLADLAAGAVSPAVCLQTNGAEFNETAFSDQAKWIAASDGETLRVWDLKRQPLQGFALAAGNFTKLCFSRDERLLGAVTGPISTERTVLVWDLASGKELARFQPHRDEIADLDFSPDGTVLATAGCDNSSKLLDLRTREVIMTLPGQLLALFSVCFSPDGRRLATGTGGESILIWDLDTGREVLVLKAHRNDVSMLRFLPTGDAVLSGDADTFHLWRAPSWAEIEAAEKRTEGKTQ